MALNLQQKASAIGGRMLLAVLLVLTLVMMTVYSREGESGPLHAVQGAFSGITAPFKFVGGALGAGTDAAASAASDATANPETLETLRAQNQELRDMNAQLEEYRQEAARLEGLLALKDMYALDTVSARVIDRSTNAWEQIVTIDSGSNAGINPGLPVMGPTGVVGQVISTTPYTSDVRLIQDPKSGVAVMIQSNRSEGILHGSLEGLLYLDDIDADAKVVVGDVVVTSGLGGSYFPGLTIGTVVKVDQVPGETARTIVVAPNSETGPLQEVLVALNMNMEVSYS